ncbi:MAG: HAD family hydrolase [Dehalococcoidia bacterium]
MTAQSPHPEPVEGRARASTDVPIRAALFDLDGTLVDSLPTIAACMVEAVRGHGLEATAEDIIPLIGAPMNILVQEIYGVSDELAERIYQDYLRLYHHGFIQRTPAHPGADALVRALHAAGLPLAVVTNKSEEGGRLMVATQGWDGLFRVVSGRDTSEPKPHPEAALSALRRLDVPAAAAALIGDTEFDMNCGRDAGLPVVVGLTGSRDAARLRAEGATHIVDTLAEVAPLLLGTRVLP